MISTGEIDVNTIQDHTGSGALCYTIDHESREMFDLLLNLPGIDLEVRDSEYLTPLNVAVLVQDEYFIRELIRAGANPLALTPEENLTIYDLASEEIREIITAEIKNKRHSLHSEPKNQGGYEESKQPDPKK